MTPLAVTTTHRRPRRSMASTRPTPGTDLAGCDLDQATVAAFDEGDPVVDLVQHPAVDRRLRQEAA